MQAFSVFATVVVSDLSLKLSPGSAAPPTPSIVEACSDSGVGAVVWVVTWFVARQQHVLFQDPKNNCAFSLKIL